MSIIFKSLKTLPMKVRGIRKVFLSTWGTCYRSNLGHSGRKATVVSYRNQHIHGGWGIVWWTYLLRCWHGYMRSSFSGQTPFDRPRRCVPNSCTSLCRCCFPTRFNVQGWSQPLVLMSVSIYWFLQADLAASVRIHCEIIGSGDVLGLWMQQNLVLSE